MNIIIPCNDDEDWKIWEQMYAVENGWRSASIESASRPMAFMIDGSKLEREGKAERESQKAFHMFSTKNLYLLHFVEYAIFYMWWQNFLGWVQRENFAFYTIG
ncbi:MAG: hypothetical protein ACLROY_12300 [Mediterraneibacter sp.]